MEDIQDKLRHRQLRAQIISEDDEGTTLNASSINQSHSDLSRVEENQYSKVDLDIDQHYPNHQLDEFQLQSAQRVEHGLQLLQSAQFQVQNPDTIM